MSKLALVAGLLVFCALDFVMSASAQIRQYVKHNPGFIVPSGLRPRVNFWKDVFSKYGQYQVVIHHRDFPQAVFMELDFRGRAAELGPIAFDKYKEREVKEAIDNVKRAFRNLATGASPRNRLEERVAQQLSFLGGGIKKYKEALDDDLIRSQTGVRDKFVEAIKRSGRYLPIIEKIFVEDFDLPIELTRLPFVESSFDYQAYSSVGAAGIWQFMPKTARLYMTVNNAVDERRDPIESSIAAARYLSYAYNRIGTWPLTVTSYNHGIAGVMKKARQMGTTDVVSLTENHDSDKRPFGFASSNFYPSLLAAIEVYDERHTLFPGIEPEPVMRIAKARVSANVMAATISKELECPIAHLQEVNFALGDRIWSGHAAIPVGYTLKVPTKYAHKLSQLKFSEIASHSPPPTAAPAYGGLVYRVRSGDYLEKISDRYKVSVDQIKKLNGLENSRLRIGQTLVIKLREVDPRIANKQKSGSSAKASSKTLAQAGPRGKTLRKATKQQSVEFEYKKAQPTKRTVESKRASTYRVQPGDTLWSLSRKFGVSVEEIAKANHSKSSLHVGQVLRIP